LTEPNERRLQAGEVYLTYLEWPGEKGPLVCLPSLTGHKGSFRAMARALAPEYQLYALDLRGRGGSSWPEEAYGFAYHAQDVLAFAESLGLDSFTVIGHSFGGTAGAYLASIRPGPVRALVLLDGGADPKEETLAAMRPAVRRMAASYPSADAYVEAMKQVTYFRPWNPTLEEYVREEAETLEDGTVRARASAAAIERDLNIHFFYSMCLHFPAVQCPTLFIRPELGLLGERGHVLDPREAAAFVAWIPQGRQVDLPGVNHYTMLLQEHPPVVEPIRAFLAEVLAALPEPT
jgi:pimeloyl-ACP methyl ester carboxylesterase